MQDLIHRMNQTAHISLQSPAISKSGETKIRLERLFLGAARLILISVFLFAARTVRPVMAFPLAPQRRR